MKPIVTCAVAGLQYLIHPQKLGSIQETINSDAIIPITLLTTDEVFGDLEGLLQLLDDYDDVFIPDFGSVLVEKPGNGNASAVNSLEDSSARQVYHLDDIVGLSDDFAELPSGPYFLHGPNLHQAWRLYDDDLGAFAFGVIPDDVNHPDEFQVLSSLSSQGSSKSIAVPSKLYHPRPSLRKPLSGIRVSISDFTSLNGTGSALSSRAWASLYSTPSMTTAGHARSLIDLGAIIVGKTKTSHLSTGVEWVDEQAPWSARGDGYQTLFGPSVGAAAGLLGYEWLQQSIGCDDHGLAAQHGLYSIAPSLGSVSFTGIMKSSIYDNGRLFSRNLKDLLQMTPTLGIISLEVNLPQKIIYPVDLHPTLNESQQRLVDEFVSTLEEFMRVRVEKVNLGEMWAKSRPVESRGEGMQIYMKDVPFHSWCYEYYHAFDDFRDGYREKFHRNPFVEATPQFLWNVGESITKDEYKEHMQRLKIYRAWFHEHIMSLDATPNAETIMILPCGTSDTRHRDDTTSPPTTSSGVTPEYLASILGAPHLAVPFAQLPYYSRISGRTEYQPVCVSLMGSFGSEVGMIRLVKQAFEQAHWPTEVSAGRFAFPLEKGSHAANNEDRLLMLQPQGLSDEL
ncbi:amidase signature domain-containing protein [Ilyonectria robusta]|uniref:amidase signature domain-containing protein n=1 Tax=Ilyonectria robusta TaxID=1079257 RepID=UPI001E8D4207|nr:amidase signature domain-containing protein [Ilyonectria robusta]KAH8734004.1 amidase signature domain-containing protein [Ilyonectria robusta]